jgi:hypothetical protein
MITVNMMSTKYEMEKFNGENNFSLAKMDERFFDLTRSLQCIIGKIKEFPENGRQ